MTGEPSLPVPPGEPSFDVERVEPLLFGTIPPLGLVSAGGLAMLAAIALLATGHWISGPLLFVLGLVALALYFVATHRRPRPRIVQRAVGRVWRVRDALRFAGSSAGAWSYAGYRVVALRRELRAIARERGGVQYELGAAAYGEEAQKAAELRQRMRELDERMAACARRMEAARRVARARVSRARVPLGTTEIIRPDR